jgi:hypothetical protein
MSTYNAKAHREGDWWVIDVEGVGVTQAKRLDQVEDMARDMVGLMLDVDISTVDVDVAPQVGAELDGLVLSARNAADAARAAQAKATETSRATAERLHAAGYSLRDIGVLTGVSYQRIHQLLEGKATRAHGKTTRAQAARNGKVRKTTRGAMEGQITTRSASSGKKVSSKDLQPKAVDA